MRLWMRWQSFCWDCMWDSRPPGGRKEPMKLGIVIKKYRVMMELDLRSLAKEIGIAASTLMRLEHGYDPEYKTFKKVLDWLSEAERTE